MSPALIQPLPALGKRILYLQFTDPHGYPPLLHSARILAEDGWQVRFLGVSFRSPDATPAPMHGGVRIRLLQAHAEGWQRKWAYFRYCLAAVFSALRWRPQWIYASDAMSSPLGCALMTLGFRVLYHEHDMPQSENPSRFMRWILSARASLVRRAHIVVVPNAERAALLIADTGRSIGPFCVWNCPHSAAALETLPSNKSGIPLRIIFQGNLNPGVLPDTLLAALAQTPENITLHIAGYETIGSTGFLDTFFKRAEAAGLKSRVVFLGHLTRPELLEQTRKCHLGLALFPTDNSNPNIQHLAGASNKVFDYLACGLPVLASNTPDWKSSLADQGLGWTCNPQSAKDIAAQLLKIDQDRTEVAAAGLRGQQKILNEWNYETQFAPVLAVLNKLLD